MIRSPWQRTAGWSPEEAAAELQRRRPELIAQLRRRSESRGVPPAAQEEIVDEAIAAVVMSPHGTAGEQHLLGAFWLAVAHRCHRYREGRHSTRLGSRQRVEFDSAVASVAAVGGPFEAVELTDRMARAADFMADLDPLERQVVSVMAVLGVGAVPAARHLGLELGEVRSAVRSANLKLERIAAIAAEGRMCGFRSSAIAADAAGEASDRDARRARAHINACVPCGRVYRKLRREMRGREFQRAAAAAFLPLPVTPIAHAGGLGRVADWLQQHVSGLPHAGAERAAEVFGGAGAAKVAAVGTAVVIAGGTLTSHVVHSVVESPAPAHRHAGRLAHRASPQSTESADTATTWARAWADPTRTTVPAASGAAARSPAVSTPRKHTPPRHSPPAPPSRSLGYLALGASSAGSSTSSSASSTPARAVVASVDRYTGTSTSTPNPSPSSEASSGSSSSSHSGGGAGLGYLGQ